MYDEPSEISLNVTIPGLDQVVCLKYCNLMALQIIWQKRHTFIEVGNRGVREHLCRSTFCAF